MTGTVVSTTFTVRVTSAAALPAASLTLYVTVYWPTIAVFTVFTTLIEVVIFPSTLSNAVAPASVYIASKSWIIV